MAGPVGEGGEAGSRQYSRCAAGCQPCAGRLGSPVSARSVTTPPVTRNTTGAARNDLAAGAAWISPFTLRSRMAGIVKGEVVQMGIIGWILLGLIAGVIAKWLMPGKGPAGWIWTILLGVVG